MNSTYRSAGQDSAITLRAAVEPAVRGRGAQRLGARRAALACAAALAAMAAGSAYAQDAHYVGNNDGGNPGANYNNEGATGVLATAVGVGASASQAADLAVGLQAQASGGQSVAIGSASKSLGHASTAVGEQAQAIGALSAALGPGATAQGNSTIAVGPKATATQTHGISIGADSLSNGAGAIAAGLLAEAQANDSVALGSRSLADRAGGILGFVPASANAAQAAAIAATQGTWGAVSVGDAAQGEFRQITSVAAGTEDSDAVNVAQLKAVAANSQAHYLSNNDGGNPGANYNNDGATGFLATAVGVGASASQAADLAVGLQAEASGGQSIAIGSGAKSLGHASTAVGEQAVASGMVSTALGAGATAQGNSTIAIGPIATATGTHGIAMGTESQSTGTRAIAMGARTAATADDGLALGPDSRVTQAGGVALGAGSVAATAPGAPGYVPATATEAQRQAILATTGTDGAVSVGDAANGRYRQINGVAAGTLDSDAANVAQLKGVQASVTEVDQNAIKYEKNGDNTVNYNDVTLQGEGGTTIHNLAPGVQGTDAANVNQVNAGVASANAYTDARVNRLDERLDKVARNAYAGVASAMAVQMPGTYVPGKTVMRVGTAVFKGEGAVGVSFRRTAESNTWSLTGGVGVSSAGVAATVGAEWVFN